MFLEQQNEDGNLPIILRPPKNLEETIKFLEENLCVSDIIKLCRLQNWALKGYWPLVFPSRGHTVPLLSQYTACSKSGDHLRQLIKDNQDVSLPKKIIIEDNDRFLKAYLRESTLEPRGFTFTSGSSDYVVTGRAQASNVGLSNADTSQNCSETTMSAQSDSEDEVFFAGSQFGDIPPYSQANDDTLPHHSSQSSGSQPPSSPSALAPSQAPSQVPSQAPSQSSPSARSTFQSVLPENMDQGLDGLGK